MKNQTNKNNRFKFLLIQSVNQLNSHVIENSIHFCLSHGQIRQCNIEQKINSREILYDSPLEKSRAPLETLIQIEEQTFFEVFGLLQKLISER